MPGPVSDSYDPEFGTSSNAQDVADAIREVRLKVSAYIGSDQLKNIVDLAQSKNGRAAHHAFSERELRIIRFCLDRSLESV